VLLSIRGSYGRLCRVPSELEGANITQDTARLALHELINPDYVVMFLKAPATQDRMRRAARGVAVRGLNIGDVRALQVALPPPKEANEIVRRVQALFAVADKIELNAVRALQRSERLPQSILSRAFRGELALSQAELPPQATGGSPIVPMP
jgi:type I restriction enzyme S subunit